MGTISALGSPLREARKATVQIAAMANNSPVCEPRGKSSAVPRAWCLERELAHALSLPCACYSKNKRALNTALAAHTMLRINVFLQTGMPLLSKEISWAALSVHRKIVIVQVVYRLSSKVDDRILSFVIKSIDLSTLGILLWAVNVCCAELYRNLTHVTLL